MTTKLTTLIEQFGGVNGAWRSSPHNQTALREPQKVKPGKGHLFILVEAQGQIPRLEVVEKQLVALARDAYYLASGGIAASLRRAVQVVNLWLFQQNNAASQNKHILAGLVAVVVRDDDLFLAQVGPAALFSAMNRFVYRYPETSDWLDSPQADQGEVGLPALGMYQYVDPLISHLQIKAGDIVIMTDGRLARQLSLADISQALRGQNVSAISQRLTHIIPQPHGSAMIIQVIAADTPAKQPVRQSVEKELVEAGAPKGKGFNFSIPHIFPRSDASTGTKPAPPQADDRLSFEQDNAEGPTSAKGDQAGLSTSWLTQVFRNIGMAVLGSVALLGSGLHTILKLVLPGSQGEPKASQKAGAKASSAPLKQPSYTALKYVAIGLPLIILIVTLLMYWYRGYNREQEYAAMISTAQQKFTAAQSASPETAVSLLAQAESELNQAATIKEGQSEIEALQTNIITRRDELGQVERLYYIPELYRYPDPGSQLRRVVIQGVEVYVLDTGLDRIFRHTLDDLGDALLPDTDNPVLLQRGQDLENVIVGDMVDMVWMPAAGGRQTSDLLIMTRDGLWEFNPDWGASPIPISGVELWQSPVAVSTYAGNFYLLDNQASLLHRYRPTLAGYEDPSESYFADPGLVDLSNAVDMTIDGHIYLLYRHGEIKKFLGGEPALFQLTGLDIPLNNPTAIYTAPDDQAQYLYVADAGNQRIVQLTKDGQFIRQFKPRLEDEAIFNDLRSIYVDEISGKMFILNGSSLYAPNIPTE